MSTYSLTSFLSLFSKPTIVKIPKVEQQKTLPQTKIQELGQQLKEWHLNALWYQENKLHGKKVVKLFKEGSELKHETLDIETNEIVTGTFGESSLFQELSTREIVNFENGHPVFAEPRLQWDVNGISVKLLQFQGIGIWQFFNSDTQSYERVPIQSNSVLNWEVCLAKTQKLFNSTLRYDKVPFEDQVKFLKFFKITEIKTNYIHLEPKRIKSLIDPRIHISRFSYIVTLIANGKGIGGNHAQIVMEGINDELKQFIHILDYTGDKIRLQLNCEELIYHERAEIQKVPGEYVESLIKKPGEVPEFSILGKIDDAHNCCTWALDVLEKKLDVEYPKGKEKKLVTYTKAFTKRKFSKVKEGFADLL